MQGLRHIQDAGGYIHFSPNTRGQSGRPVKIHTNLFVDFFCAVNPGTQSGQTIIRDIESLRAKQAPDVRHVAVAPRPTPRNQGSQHAANLNKINKALSAMADQQEVARERVYATNSVRIFYQIAQKADQGDRHQTVYISEIQVLSKQGQYKGGLYEYQQTRASRKLVPSKNQQLADKSVYISRAIEDPNTAMKEAMLTAREANPALFFNPEHIKDDLKIWKASKRLQNSTKEVVSKLSSLLQSNQKSSVSWHVSGEGAAVLSHALDAIPGTLDNHQFKFYNTRAQLPQLMQKLASKKAKLDGEFINLDTDRIALLALAGNQSALSEQLDKLPTPPGYEKITRRYLKEQMSALCRVASSQPAITQSSKLRGSEKTFIDVLHTVYASVS